MDHHSHSHVNLRIHKIAFTTVVMDSYLILILEDLEA